MSRKERTIWYRDLYQATRDSIKFDVDVDDDEDNDEEEEEEEEENEENGDEFTLVVISSCISARTVVAMSVKA